MLPEIRYAFRSLAKRPSSTVLTVLVFALAIGANTSMFTVFNGFFFRPMPFPDDRVVALYGSLPRAGVEDTGASIEDYLDFRTRVPALEEAAIFARAERTLQDGPIPERTSVIRVSPSLLAVLNVAPAIGRGFTEDEVVPGNERVLLLSHNLWAERFGSRSDVVGKDVRLDDELFRVIGVMPEGFGFPDFSADGWVPLAYTFAESGELQRLDDDYTEGIGRLKPGATLERLNGELAALARANVDRLSVPADFLAATGYTIRAEPLRNYVMGDLRSRLLVLQGLVLAVLLIACTNVANLQLSRLETRRQELAVRAALGAGALGLARLVIIEGIMLASAGATVGLLVAHAGTELVRVLGLAHASSGFEPRLDAVVLAVTFGAALLAALLSALLPLIALLREDLARTVQESGRRYTGSVATGYWRSGLVVVQLTVSVALLTGAGLLAKTFNEFLRQGPGFDPAGVWSAGVEFPTSLSYADDAARGRFFAQVLRELRSLPGVDTAGFTTMLPFVSSDYGATVVADGHELLDGAMVQVAQLHSIDHGYFTTLGIPVVKGRNFAFSETERVAIVDERFARSYWLDGNPLGERLRNSAAPDSDWYTIVGVVPHVKHNSFTGDEYAHTVYWHYEQRPPPEGTGMLVLRTALPFESMTRAVQATIARVDPLVTLTDVRMMEARVRDALGPQRVPMVLTLVFAAIAVALAVAGVYGVLAWAVARRAEEIGVRVALGARSADVLWMVMKQGARMIGAGLALGTAGALALGRVISAQIPGVAAVDTAVLGVAALVLSCAALTACWFPARCAARLYPLQALR